MFDDALPRGFDMQGNLKNINLTEIFLQLYLDRRSGILRISQSDVKKSIYFLDGSVVFAHSNQKYDRLGETLLRLGKITLEEFEVASRDVIDKGKRLGQSLCDLGFISAQEVSSSVHYQLQQITFSLFDWDAGEFEFVERERPVYEDIMIEVSTPNLIVDGIRNITNPAVLERCYQKNENQILFPSAGDPKLPRLDLDFGEETVLACVDGTKTIEAVRQLAHLSRIEFDRALSSLLLSGLLQLGKEAPQSEKKAEPDAKAPSMDRSPFATQPMSSAKPAQTQSGLKTLSEDELRRLIATTEQKFQTATDEEVLSVLPDCTKEEIDKAYDELAAQFQPPYQSHNRFKDLKDNLKRILDRLAEAHDQLISRARSQYLFSEAPFDAAQRSAPASPSAPPKEATKPLVTPSKPDTASANAVKESISSLQEQLRKDPANTALLRKLGKRFHEAGKPHEGEKHLLKALELEPQNVENHFALADFYGSMGLKIKAFRLLNIVLQIQPNNERALELLNLKKTSKALYEIKSGPREHSNT